jgi:uncharacterized membrane protein
MAFTPKEKEDIAHAIAAAERLTTAEIRLFVEARCGSMAPLQRAAQVFEELKMDKTKHHNAVLMYVALHDRRFALYGDAAVHSLLTPSFWWQTSLHLQNDLVNGSVAEGLCKAAIRLGESLSHYFPDDGSEENYLPNDLLIGDGL